MRVVENLAKLLKIAKQEILVTCLRIAALVSTFEGIVAVTPFSAKDVSKAGC